MKDKIISGLSTLFTILVLICCVTLSAWGVWYTGRGLKNCVVRSFADEPATASRQFLKDLAPPLAKAAQWCKDSTDPKTGASATTCRVTTPDSDRIIRCTAGSTTAGTAGDPECHVAVDFNAKQQPATPPPSSTPPADAGVDATTKPAK